MSLYNNLKKIFRRARRAAGRFAPCWRRCAPPDMRSSGFAAAAQGSVDLHLGETLNIHLDVN